MLQSQPGQHLSLPPQPNPVVPPSTINKQRKQEPEHKTFISGKIGSAFLWDCAPSNPLSLPSSLHRRGPNPAGTMTPAALGTRTHKHKHGTGLETGSRAGVERNGVGLQRGVSSIDTALEKEKRDKKPRPQRTFRTDELLLSTNQKPDLGIAFDTQLNLFYHV